MRVDLPLPGRDKEYNSRKSRARLLNLMVEQNADGSFRSIKKREALTTLISNSEVIISNLIPNEGLTAFYYAGPTDLFQYALSTGTIANLGAHGFTIGLTSEVWALQNTSKPGPGTLVQTMLETMQH